MGRLQQPRKEPEHLKASANGSAANLRILFPARTLCRKGHRNRTLIPNTSINGQHDSGQRTFSRFAQARLGGSVNQIDRPYPSAPVNVLDDGIFYAAILHKKNSNKNCCPIAKKRNYSAKS
jgi:hypothetical protein